VNLIVPSSIPFALSVSKRSENNALTSKLLQHFDQTQAQRERVSMKRSVNLRQFTPHMTFSSEKLA